MFIGVFPLNVSKQNITIPAWLFESFFYKQCEGAYRMPIRFSSFSVGVAELSDHFTPALTTSLSAGEGADDCKRPGVKQCSCTLDLAIGGERS